MPGTFEAIAEGLKGLKVRARAERMTHRTDTFSFSECLGKEIEMIAHANKFVSNFP